MRRARVRSLLRRVDILRMRPFSGDDEAEEEVGPVQRETSRRRDKWDDVGHPVRAGRKDAMTTRSQRRITLECWIPPILPTPSTSSRSRSRWQLALHIIYCAALLTEVQPLVYTLPG